MLLTSEGFCIIILEQSNSHKNADVTQWQSVRFPSRIRGFDSRHLLQKEHEVALRLRALFLINCTNRTPQSLL